MDRRVKSRAFISQLSNQSFVIRYGIAMLAVAAAVLMTMLLPVFGERAVFLIVSFTIFQVTLWHGTNPGILATILSIAAVNILILQPIWISTPSDMLLLNVGFCGLSAMIIATAGLHRNLTISLKESRHDLEHAQEVGQIGSWRFNLRRNEFYWSPENYRIFGIDPGTVLNYETFLDIVHPDDRDFVDHRWKSTLCGEPYDVEHRLAVAGEVKWVREKAVLEFDADGNLLGGFGTTQDITKRKQIELALLESRQRYAGIVESAMDAIISTDAEHNIILFNAAAEKMFGCPAHEAIGEPVDRFIPQRFRVAHREHVRNFALYGITNRRMNATHELVGLRANGEEFPVEASISQAIAGDKKIFTVILRDISERHKAEMALREKEYDLQMIMDASPALLSYIDTDYKYLRANAAYEHWLGITVASMRGRYVREIIGEDSWALLGPYLERAMAGEYITFDKQIPYADKEPRWVNASYIPARDADGKIKGVVVHVVDIEERKRMELERHKFVSLAENSREFIGICDMQFMPFYLNPAGLRLVGLDSMEQACQTPVEEFFFPEDRRYIMEEFFPRVIREGSAEVEIRFRHFKTGTVMWMIYNAFYIEDDAGAPIGLATVSHDITARKLAEKALQENEEWLRQAKHAAGLGIYDHDMNSGAVRWDDRVRELWGVAPHETVTLSTFLNGLHPEDRPLIKAEMVRACNSRGNGEYFAEARVISRSGKQQKWVAIYGKVSFDAGHPIRFVGIIQDISARKAVEQSLVKSERRNRFLAEILENADQPFAAGYTDGRLGYANRAFEQLTGYSLEELTAINWMETLTPAEWRVSDQTKLEKLRHDRRPVRYQKDLLRKDGTLVPIELLVGLMNDPDSPRGRYYAFISDLTERRAAQTALQENEARLKLAVEAANIGLWDHDLIAGTVYFSPEWKRQIGYNDNELPNRWKEWESRLHPDERKHILAVTEDYLAGRLPEYILEFRLRHKDGSYRWIYCRGTLLRDRDERPRRLIGINVDITDYKISQNLHESRGRMEETSRFHIASQTAAAIAHELNQPLTAVASYTDVALLMLQNGNSQPEKLARVLESCSQQAHRAGQVTRQLATVLHKGETATEPVSLAATLQEAVDIVRIEGNLGSFTIAQHLPEDLPAVLANRLQIEKVFVNLLHNSIEAMSECKLRKGTITVIGCTVNGGTPMAMITVRDEGKGVADATILKSMFQPFYTTKPTSLGLGLATSRALIEAHGGKMWAEQDPGECLSINFTLPLAI